MNTEHFAPLRAGKKTERISISFLCAIGTGICSCSAQAQLHEVTMELMEHARNIFSCEPSSSTSACAREERLSRELRVPDPNLPARIVERCSSATPATHGRPALGKKLLLEFGPPGTGKTTRLLHLLGTEFKAGTPSTEIAFVTFTRAARAEARSRVLQEFHFVEDDLPWFRTIHSAAYRLLDLAHDQVMDHSRWREFGTRYGYDLTGGARVHTDDDPFLPPMRTDDDLLRAVVQWGANRRLDIDVALGRCQINAPAAQVRLFADRLGGFKREQGLVDFSDMLEQVIGRGLRPDVSVGFVDEGQDLSPLQIAVVEMWFGDCERVYVAGDDDQAIYNFQGAEPAWLLSLSERSTVVETLRQSYRVPARVHQLARRIIRQNRTRVTKAYEPRTEPGSILVLPADRVLGAVGDADDIFILSRNWRFLGPWADRLRDAGEPFVVERRNVNSPLGDPDVARAVAAGLRLREQKAIGARDLEALLKFVPSRCGGLLPHGVKKRAERNQDPVTRGELEQEWGLDPLLGHLDAVGPVQVLLKLRSQDRQYVERLLSSQKDGRLPEPRFRLLSIHAAKGREADVVVVVPDMTRASHAEYVQLGREGEEAENRVAYVAVTRARRCLILVEPTTRRFYPYAQFLRGAAPDVQRPVPLPDVSTERARRPNPLLTGNSGGRKAFECPKHSPPSRAPACDLELPAVAAEQPACGHTDRVAYLIVDGHGTLCADCWRRWVAGNIDWPGKGPFRVPGDEP